MRYSSRCGLCAKCDTKILRHKLVARTRLNSSHFDSKLLIIIGVRCRTGGTSANTRDQCDNNCMRMPHLCYYSGCSFRHPPGLVWRRSNVPQLLNARSSDELHPKCMLRDGAYFPVQVMCRKAICE